MPNQYVNKVQQSNGTVLIDITDTTAVASDVATGKYFYLATGEKVEGTSSGGGGGGSVTVTDEPNATGITCVITTSSEPTPPEPSGDWDTIYDGSITVTNREWSLSSLTNQYVLGDVWRVTFDNVEYTYSVAHSDTFDTNYIGNILIAQEHASTGDPFLSYNIVGYLMGNSYLDGTHTLKLERQLTS